MAAKKKVVTEEVNTATEEVKAVTEEADALKQSFEDPSTLPARLTLDRLLQNATASRQTLAWERYRGALEMAGSFGYTINVMGERFHVLVKTV